MGIKGLSVPHNRFVRKVCGSYFPIDAPLPEPRIPGIVPRGSEQSGSPARAIPLFVPWPQGSPVPHNRYRPSDSFFQDRARNPRIPTFLIIAPIDPTPTGIPESSELLIPLEPTIVRIGCVNDSGVPGIRYGLCGF